MNAEEAGMYFGARLDNSQLKQSAQEANEILHGITDGASDKLDGFSDRIKSLITDVPKVNVDFEADVSDLELVRNSINEVNRVMDVNEKQTVELIYALNDAESAYHKLGTTEGKEAEKLREQIGVLKGSLDMRKKLAKELEDADGKLRRLKATMTETKKSTEDNAEQHVSLRKRLREVKEELVELEAAGQRGTARYRELQQEAGRLTDAWSDAQAQANVLANDQRGIQGVIGGLQGLAGAASVATGVFGVFGAENEKVQQIMLKVQSLMAISMGLQQVANTLNKDSAFSLVTLNGIREMWNKLMGESTDALEEEITATAANTAGKDANAAATVADTAAEVANKNATKAGTAATNAATGAEAANTAATQAHTTATVAQSVATKAASLAMKGLRAALISTGIGALVVLVGELVGWLTKLFETTSKAEEKQKEVNEVMAKGHEAYAKARVEINDYITKIENFNGTKKQENQLIKELNTKYGTAIGHYQSLKEWKKQLIEKGEAYCKVLLKEAHAQAILSKYTEAYIHLKEVEKKAANGDYDDKWYEFWNWGGKSSEEKRKEEIGKAEKDMNDWLDMYNTTMMEAQKIRDEFDLNYHIDPSKSVGKTFDPKKAALEIQKAVKEYNEAVKKYVKDANDELNALIISGQKQGLVRELNEIRTGTRKRLEAWQENLRQLANVRQATAKAQYMNTKGATEVGWSQSENGKKSIDDWIEVIKKESPKVIEEYNRVWQTISDEGENAIALTTQKYTDALIDEFGTQTQKADKLLREWQEKLALLPAEFLPQATEQMEQEFAKLDSEKFKMGIDWESVFGNLSEQAVPVLERTLGKVRKFFEENKKSMSTQEIKDYQEAIANMEQEIASRNPFAAMGKSLRDIKISQYEMIIASDKIKEAQKELTAATNERTEAQKELNEIIEKEEAGKLAKDSEEQKKAVERLAEAKKRVAKATDEVNKADVSYNKALNKNTQSYKKFAASLRDVGEVVGGIGRNAEKLASVFNDKVANSIGKAVAFMDEAVDSASTAINAIGDLGKNVAKGVENTVQATADGAKTAATTASKAISTVEKASAVLAIISAAIQLATAVASLFNDDDDKQEEIERLQRRIDQLRWELDNGDIVRMKERNGKAIDIVNKAIDDTRKSLSEEYKQLSQIHGFWERINATARLNAAVVSKSAERIATAYANMGYTADKALGAEKFSNARKQLENLAQQQILVQQQIDKERDKKKTDYGQIEEWEKKIEELGAEALKLINEMVEDIIGGSSTDIAKQLADAFFEAFGAGEDAAEAWGDKVNAIVADVLKRMMVSKFLEEPLGDIFNKYKAKWFKDGNFVGIDAVVASMTAFRNDLNSTYGSFAEVMEAIPQDLRDMFVNADSTRAGVEKGIAQASQDSVDELNGRATAIQGHTYSIANDTRLLLGVANAILENVVNIDASTDGLTDKVDRLQSDIKAMRDDISEMATKGIIIKR